MIIFKMNFSSSDVVFEMLMGKTKINPETFIENMEKIVDISSLVRVDSHS